MVKKSAELRHISLMPWGHWVRYYRKRRAFIAKMFKFKDYPTDEECLKAAQKWRDENRPTTTYSQKYRFKTEPSSRNELGIKGVAIYCYPRKFGVTYYARGIWTDKCKSHSKYFSMTKFGWEEALRLAKEYRDNKEKEVLERVRLERLEEEKNMQEFAVKKV